MPLPARDLVPPLVRWYRACARDLPWRREPSPYHVLLSELMSQQTRIDTVLPYFARFVARWPTLEALASADESDVVEAWAGLGYYSRARHLHRAARAAVARGGLPEDPAALRALPGIGPYTAGAVASLAFGVAAPVVDGNVERVLSRVDGRDADPRSAAGRRELWARAEELVAAGDPRLVNQGLMELGALVCSPRRPACGSCPWSGDCAARASGDPERLPRLAKKKPPAPISGAAGLLVRDGWLLVARRRPGGLLGGLWEPVRVGLDGGLEPREALRAAFLAAAGLEVRVGRLLGEVRHTFSHRQLSLWVHAVEGAGEPVAGGDYDAVSWRRHGEVEGLSTLARKVTALTVPADQLSLLAADGDSPVRG